MTIQILRRRSDKGDELAYPIEALGLFEWYVNIKFLYGWKHSASHCKNHLVNTVQGSNPCLFRESYQSNKRQMQIYCLCRWGETTSLNCGHQEAYCSSARWYTRMNTEGHGGIISTGENSWLFTRYIWQLYQQSPSSEWGSGRKECWILPTKYLFHTLRVL
jgi:hypothetical protein